MNFNNYGLYDAVDNESNIMESVDENSVLNNDVVYNNNNNNVSYNNENVHLAPVQTVVEDVNNNGVTYKQKQLSSFDLWLANLFGVKKVHDLDRLKNWLMCIICTIVIVIIVIVGFIIYKNRNKVEKISVPEPKNGGFTFSF